MCASLRELKNVLKDMFRLKPQDVNIIIAAVMFHLFEGILTEMCSASGISSREDSIMKVSCTQSFLI